MIAKMDALVVAVPAVAQLKHAFQIGNQYFLSKQEICFPGRFLIVFYLIN